MRVSILEGVYVGNSANIRTSYPMNLTPVLGENGLSDGYLRTSPGLTLYANGPGADRAALMWNGAHYRVMGSRLIYLHDGVLQDLGDVGNDGKPASLDYGFDRLMIVSNGGLYYWVLLTLVHVTDPNVGTPIDGCWIDGYYMLTDGTYLYVTELNDPTTINPLKYGSAEADPDPIVAVRRVRDEIYAIGTNTIENFQNVGGTGFPFQRNPGGLIPKGACGTHAVCYYLDTLGFVGSGRNEGLSVYIAGYGTTECISTPEVDRQLQSLTLAQRAALEVESITQLDEQRLYIHFPTKTLVYHRQASLKAQKPIWSQLSAGVNMDQAYPARHFAYSGYGWMGGTPAGAVGSLDETVQTQFLASCTAQLDTVFLFNDGKGAILKSAELFGTPGLSTSLVSPPMGHLSWTRNGQVWSQEMTASLGLNGQFNQRMQWRPKTRMRTEMGLRFRFPDPAIISFAALDVQAEPLDV